MTYEAEFSEYFRMTEETLARLLDTEGAFAPIPRGLLDAMRYSVLAGGKRLRPVLLLAVCRMLGGPLEEARVPAAALEMIHTYSLIHDDLPGMDDDDYRRGRLTNHRVYGVGNAILAGDALLNGAFECLLRNALKWPGHLERHVRAAEAIARRAGVSGMIAGQSVDLRSEHETPGMETLSYIHAHKTADLLTAPLEAGAYLAGATEDALDALQRFGFAAGTAFQIDDDILDVEGDAALMGKNTGMDEARGKMTWPALVGLPAAKEASAQRWREAVDALSCFGPEADFLRAFAERTARRKG